MLQTFYLSNIMILFHGMESIKIKDYILSCPACGAETVMFLNETEEQHYVEDCEICQSVIEVDFKLNNDGVIMSVDLK